MFIVFEGVDASRKTTTAKLLAEHINAIYYATPPGKYMSQREEFDRNADNDGHYQFYLKGILEASAEIQLMLNAGKTIVVDRYWASTYVTHRVMGANVSRDDFKGIVFPELTVLLLVSPEVQSARLDRRGISAGERRLIHKQAEVAREFRQLLKTEGRPLIQIDTSEMNSQEVAALVLTKMMNFKK